ncbi:uncharacterized protein LOC108741510 isoform X2 [Agrilus planipennis]|uniref:Uncharacterized protein LOC108741510 isoform X2 n=1 Tax=Agrilus planipennis TaxID=224129 RepID=A0A1W4X6W8_AGRPL|nr:uncharacterized protein LOC108741510 isoform X2 [Agrilus planipennis]
MDSIDDIEAVLSAMSNRINKLFSRLPANYDGNVVVPLTNFQIPSDINIDFGKANSTSVTKLVNGHKVTINDTDYRNEAGNETSFFHVRVVDIHPDNHNGTISQDVLEEVKNEFDHESEEDNTILNNNDEEVLQLDPYAPIKIQKRKDNEWTEEEWSNQNAQPLDLQNIETFDEKSNVEFQPPMRDLSNDIYVNEIMANSGAPMDPNAEFIKKDPIPPLFVRQNNKAELLMPSPKNNYYYYDVVPMKPVVDLSNDIYVNEIMENSGAPINPDAELIDSKTFRQPRSFKNSNP